MFSIKAGVTFMQENLNIWHKPKTLYAFPWGLCICCTQSEAYRCKKMCWGHVPSTLKTMAGCFYWVGDTACLALTFLKEITGCAGLWSHVLTMPTSLQDLINYALWFRALHMGLHCTASSAMAQRTFTSLFGQCLISPMQIKHSSSSTEKNHEESTSNSTSQMMEIISTYTHPNAKKSGGSHKNWWVKSHTVTVHWCTRWLSDAACYWDCPTRGCW